MIGRLLAIGAACMVTVCAWTLQAAPDPNFHCYLLFGQSNMAGGGAGVPIGGSGAGTLIPADCDTTPRVKVLAFCNCNAGAEAACSQFKNKSRIADTWYTAYPALHICDEGVSPGDWFAKTLLDSIRTDITIGLIPCALSGQALQVFVKGKSGFNLPTWAHPTLGNGSPYTWMLNRCKLALQTGVIKGILLHQGESGSGAGDWVAMAEGIFNDLKKDLELDSLLPVVVGELRADQYASFNANNVDKIAKQYPNCGLASSAGLSVQSDDTWHFNAAGMRELGRRYAQAFLSLAGPAYVPRKGMVRTYEHRAPQATSSVVVHSWTGDATVYSLDGKILKTTGPSSKHDAWRGMRPGKLCIIVRNPDDNARIMMVP